MCTRFYTDHDKERFAIRSNRRDVYSSKGSKKGDGRGHGRSPRVAASLQITTWAEEHTNLTFHVFSDPSKALNCNHRRVVVTLQERSQSREAKAARPPPFRHGPKSPSASYCCNSSTRYSCEPVGHCWS